MSDSCPATPLGCQDIVTRPLAAGLQPARPPQPSTTAPGPGQVDGLRRSRRTSRQSTGVDVAPVEPGTAQVGAAQPHAPQLRAGEVGADRSRPTGRRR
jgi:hypothetical protein